ncbi:MAG TPA: hypothetical protein VG711_05615 [Phycisphaerales bacterium]|nr:hypothetical protein [Phycisphaerales bacterium]
MTFSRSLRSSIIILAVVSPLFILSACSDSSAEAREHVQQQLSAISDKIAHAGTQLTTSEDGVAKTRKIVNDAITSLNALNPTDDGLVASKALLIANANRSLADLAIAQAADIEREMTSDRVAIHTSARSLLSLAALNNGQQAISTAPLRQDLQQASASASASTDELLKDVNALNEPINDLTQQKAADSKKIEELRLHAQQLLREASERGPSEGLSTFQQAMQILAQSDKLEIALYSRDIKLENDLQPAHSLAMTKIEGHRAVMSGIDETNQTFDAFDSAQKTSQSETSTLISDRASQIEKSLKSLSDRKSTDLQPLYQTALDNLEKAKKAAQQAASKLKGADAVPANILLAQLELTEGRVHTAAAHDASAVYRPLALVARVPQASKFKSAADEALASATSELDAARTAFTSAKDTIGKVSGSGSNASLVTSLQKNLDDAIADLNPPSADIDPLPTEVDESSSAPAASSTDAASSDDAAPQDSRPVPDSGGAESPEALINRVNELAALDVSAADKSEGLGELMYADTDQGRSLINFTTTMVKTAFELVDAMTVKFGADETKAALSKGQTNKALDFPKLSMNDITEQSETRVVLKSDMLDTGDNSLTLIKLGNRWFIDADEAGEQAGAAVQMMASMVAPAMKAIADVSRRVRAGEFETAEAAANAMEQEIMKAMSPGGMSHSGNDGSQDESDK